MRENESKDGKKDEKKGRTKRRAALGFLAMALLVGVLTGLLIKGCNYLLTDDASSYTRLTMHELYETAESGENIDTLFLGSSHCFRAYDPELFTELTGKSSFNLGSSSQNYDTSYYLLREAARYNDLKTVYLDMHYKFLFIDKKDRDLVQANIITDYMRPSLNKLEFLLAASEPQEYTNRFLPFRRNWQQLGDVSYLKSVWEKKQEESYREYAPVVLEDEYYAGRGFVWSDAELHAEEITWWDNFTDVPEDMALAGSVTFTLDYIEKIAEFCEKEGIRLIFVTAPSFEGYLDEIGPYDPAHAYIQELADRLGVPYLDFNLCREEYLSLGQEFFIDVDHLNGNGAVAVTTLLSELDRALDETGSETDERNGADSAERAEVLIDEYFRACYDKE